MGDRSGPAMAERLEVADVPTPIGTFRVVYRGPGAVILVRAT